MTIQIIKKKIRNGLQAKNSDLTFGDVRSQMASDLLKSLTVVIERKAKHPRPYFILVSAKLDPAFPNGQVIKERIILLDEKPKTKFIGTILIRIDNKNSDAEIIWCLPLDIPGPPIEQEANPRRILRPGEASIMDSAKGLPIFHRTLN